MIINIGRNKNNDVIIDNIKVSNSHAQLIIDEKGKVFINDLQSENGTFVNNVIINEPTEIKKNDIVQLANIPFDWRKHVPQKKAIEVPVEKKVSKKNNNFLLIIISLLIAILIIISFLFYNETYNEIESQPNSDVEKVEKEIEEPEKKDKKPKDSNKSKPKKKSPPKINQNISYDYSCLEDDKDMGTTNIINVFSEIGEEMVEIGTEKISLKEEIDYATESHKKIKEDYKLLYDNRTSNLNSILKKLTKSIKNPFGYNYKIYLVEDETINAFTTGGGYIYIFEGMYDYLNSNDEIAAIIGHEIYHNELGHIREHLRIKKTNNTLFGEIGNVLTSVQSILTLSFNQRKETECDFNGIDLCANTGYKMCATSSIWKRMKEEENEFNTLGNLFRTHPYSEKREDCAKNHLKNNYSVNCQ